MSKKLKPFDLRAALSGEPVMLRNGSKAYVRHHETELPVDEDTRLSGFISDGSPIDWCESGRHAASIAKEPTDFDIVGMWPETRILNGFEVPSPETEELNYGTEYYLASILAEHFYRDEVWGGYYNDKLWLKYGLVFLNREAAIANAKAMLCIDPGKPSTD